MVLHKSGLGSFLDSLHRDGSLTVTVYVDDIIVSSDDVKKLVLVSKELALRVAKSGFSLNPGKSQGPATAITVFNIELVAGKALAIIDARLDEFSALLAASKSDHQVAGVLAYVRSVNVEQAGAIEPT